MRKIDALAAIMGTNRIAYSAEEGIAIFCGRCVYFGAVKLLNGGIIEGRCEVDNLVNQSLANEDWGVSDDKPICLKDFIFPGELVEVTPEKMFMLLVEANEPVKCFVRDNVGEQLAEAFIDAVGYNRFIDTDGYSWDICKVKKDVLDKAGIHY